MRHQLPHRYYGEVLPYLEVYREEEGVENVAMPNVLGMSFKDAKTVIQENGLEIQENNGLNAGGIVIDQIPKAGIKVDAGTEIILTVE